MSEGPTGATGPTGPITYYIFDGGSPGTIFTDGPAFNCGGPGITGTTGPSGAYNGANIVMQLRHGNAADWEPVNPVLAIGEMGYEVDTGRFKIGNGLTGWNSLLYGVTTTYTGPTGVNGIGTTSSWIASESPEVSGNFYYASDLAGVVTLNINLLDENGVDQTPMFITLAALVQVGLPVVFTITNGTLILSFYVTSASPTPSGQFTIIGPAIRDDGLSGPSSYVVSYNTSGGGTGTTGMGGMGPTGPTGPTGQVIYSSIVFDGGSATSTYAFGPAFDCGTAI